MKYGLAHATSVTVTFALCIVSVIAVGYLVLSSQVTLTTTLSTKNSDSGKSSRNSGSSDTFLTRCVVTGLGELQIQVVSDNTGIPVSGETINATDRLGCDIIGQVSETQVLHVVTFVQGQDGWLSPVFPNQATPSGKLNVTVSYGGATYMFAALVPPAGISCIRLHVPSGNVTRLQTSSQCS